MNKTLLLKIGRWGFIVCRQEFNIGGNIMKDKVRPLYSEFQGFLYTAFEDGEHMQKNISLHQMKKLKRRGVSNTLAFLNPCTIMSQTNYRRIE
jgi:hypothetical protein